jgi:hypothetical protein
VKRWRHHYLDEKIAHRLRRRLVHHRIEGDHRAKRRHWVGGSRLSEGLDGRTGDGDATGRRVLDHAAGGPSGPAADRPHPRVDVEQVVERELLPLPLGEVPHAPRFLGHVERRALGRVLSVAQRLYSLHGESQPARELLLLGREIARDGRVVIRGVGEDLGRELTAGLGRNDPTAEHLQH